MPKWKLSILLIIFLVSGVALSANAGEESFVIELSDGQTGEKLDASLMEWPDWFDRGIELANQKQVRFFVTIYNGPTEWTTARQLASRDTTGTVDAHHLSLVLDAALNLVREQNVNRLMREKGLRLDIQYIHERANKPSIDIRFVQHSWLEPVQQNTQKIAYLERDFATMSGGLKPSKDAQISSQDVTVIGYSKFALAAMAGATTTRYMIVPEISGALIYREYIMLRANGFHGLGITEERSIYDQLESTYDKGWGVGLGFRPEILGPIWIYGGVHAQCNTLITSELAGDNTGWFHGGEIGLMLITDNFSISATYLYGDVKEYDNGVIDESDFRLSINLGNVWR